LAQIHLGEEIIHKLRRRTQLEMSNLLKSHSKCCWLSRDLKFLIQCLISLQYCSS